MYLGIDLGTSNSAIASYLDGNWRVLKTIDKGADVLPSAIYIDWRKSKFYGHRAYDCLFEKPDDTVSGFKRRMGESWKKEFVKSGVIMTAEECSADILRQLIAQAHVEHGKQEFAGAVITVPAAFNQMQREATLRAAKMAELEKVVLLSEPVAAALAVVARRKEKDGIFLVYDIGGGTFDLALVKSANGEVNIEAHEGINALGGRDFDRAIIHGIVFPWLLKNFALPGNFQKEKKYKKMLARVERKVEEAKIALSAKEEVEIYIESDDLNVTDEDDNDIFVEILLTRENYERIIADKLAETIDAAKRIINSNKNYPKIDRIIFIGGPSKTPRIRELIPQELNIEADISADPMTAVAVGAAIYCESIDWKSGNIARKKSRGRVHGSGNVEIQYDYESRTASNGACLRIKPQGDVVSEGYEIQIDSTEGWSSGRKALNGDIAMELPLDNEGENRFWARVYDLNGYLVKEATAEITISRVHAIAGPSKLSHHLSVAVRQEDGEKNVLHIFAKKGIALPAKGESPLFRVAKNLSKAEDTLRVDFFQQSNDENMIPSEPNLHIGAVEVRHGDLKKDIRRDDDITILWSVDESGHVSVEIKLNKTGDIFSGKFYSPELGHRSYEGQDGDRLLADMLKSAKKEMMAAEKFSETEKEKEDLRKIEESLESQRAKSHNAYDGEERRSICEKIRDIRQKISVFRNDPKNRRKEIQAELERMIFLFNNRCRKDVSDDVCEKFDTLGEEAKRSLETSNIGYEVAVSRIKEMTKIYVDLADNYFSFWQWWFDCFSSRRSAAISFIKHDRLVERGKDAIGKNDIDALRAIVRDLGDNQRGGWSGNRVDTLSDLNLPR